MSLEPIAGILAETDQRQQQFLAVCAARHARLCPRQVLGVRIGLWGAELLGLEIPRSDKRLLVIVESDGCGADGIESVTGCRIGRRTLRVMDFGKLAATFVDTNTGQAIRVSPRAGIREAAWRYAAGAESSWQAQLAAYQVVPVEDLLQAIEVTLQPELPVLLGLPGHRTQCSRCHEEILNQREVLCEGSIVCRACAGEMYYRPSQ